MNIIIKRLISYDKKWSDPEYCLQAVKNDPEKFRNVRVQTPEMCEIAIEHNPRLLAVVENQTPELCVKAIKKNNYVYVHVRLPETEPEKTEFINRLNELLDESGLTKFSWY